MSRHKITWIRSGSHPTMGDWEAEHEITFEFRAGAPECAPTYSHGGLPADPDEIEFVSITPGAGDHGVFSDIAQRDLENAAQEWLETDGFDEAMSIVLADQEYEREYAAELRSGR